MEEHMSLPTHLEVAAAVVLEYWWVLPTALFDKQLAQ
jgi:hypothetical protein